MNNTAAVTGDSQNVSNVTSRRANESELGKTTGLTALLHGKCCNGTKRQGSRPKPTIGSIMGAVGAAGRR
jgi:hypothetical protein